VTPSSIAATEVKNEFGRVLDMVIQGNVVVITKHDAPKAVLLSVDEFNALATVGDSVLASMTGEYEAMLARMQTPKARAGMKAAFNATPARLGRAAVNAARRKRG
jgi:prevent-host-death family protein